MFSFLPAKNATNQVNRNADDLQNTLGKKLSGFGLTDLVNGMRFLKREFHEPVRSPAVLLTP